MDLDMAMDMMNHEEIMRAISQLDRALACLSSPSTSPSASPPRQPLVHVPSNPFLPVRMPPVPPPAALNSEHAATRQQQLVAIVAADDVATRSRRRPRNVRISSEPQSVAARLRRERVSQRMRALQRLVPGGARLDTASMLEEAIRYVRFLKNHVQALEQLAAAAATVQGRVDATAVGGFYSCPPYHA